MTQSAQIAGMTITDAVIADVSTAVGGTVVKKLTLSITLAMLNALGATTAGNMDFATALPANAYVVGGFFTNLGSAFTGGVASMAMALVTSGQSVVFTVAQTSLQTADRRGYSALIVSGATFTAAQLPRSAGFTPSVRVAITGINLNALTGGANGILAELFYVEYP